MDSEREQNKVGVMSKVKNYDVSGMGNPLVDILVEVDDNFLESHRLNKGIMHLIDEERKNHLIDIIRDTRPRMEAGGSCPNTITALAMLGLRVALTGKIGQDDFGRIFEEKIVQRNVFSYMKKECCDTGVSIILITPDKERTMNTHLGACREFTKKDLPVHVIENSSIFYFTGYMWDTENQKAAIDYALQRAKKHGVRIVFDVADPFAVERNRDAFLRIIEQKADIVLANAEEARILMGENIEKAVQKLSEVCSLAVIKNGAKETHISSDGNIFTVPSFQSKVKDTTGAGDSFAAGFLYGLIKNYPIDVCGKIASFIASKTIEKVGAQAPDNIRELVEGLVTEAG
jgi:sugar/nucleoside kinase (ribokinase family)